MAHHWGRQLSLARICNACVALAKSFFLLLLLRNTPIANRRERRQNKFHLPHNKDNTPIQIALSYIL